MSDGLTGRAVWITGAGTGIGRAIALAFGAAGCRLALTGRSRETLAETQAAVEAAGGSAILAMADVSDAHAVTAAHRAVSEALGDIDILVNNAGDQYGAAGVAGAVGGWTWPSWWTSI